MCDHTSREHWVNVLWVQLFHKGFLSIRNRAKIKLFQHQSELFTESCFSSPGRGGISGPMIIYSGVPSPPSRIGSCCGGSPIPERDIKIISFHDWIFSYYTGLPTSRAPWLCWREIPTGKKILLINWPKMRSITFQKITRAQFIPKYGPNTLLSEVLLIMGYFLLKCNASIHYL